MEITIDAEGLVAVRFGVDGNLEALAAGGLKRFAAPQHSIELRERVDMALWRDAHGNWSGVLQGYEGPVPDPLLKLTPVWTRVSLPNPFTP